MKEVAASGRVGVNKDGGFTARLVGYSSGGAATPAIFSKVVPVFANCTLIKDTGDAV